MKLSLYLLVLVLGSALLLSACGGSIGASSWAGMTVDKDTVYISNNTAIFAVNVKDGTIVTTPDGKSWRYPEKPDTKKVFYAAPVLSNDQLIVGDYGNTLYSLNAQNATERWTFTQAKGRFVSSVLVVNDTILAPCVDYYLYALDLQGGLRWNFKTGGAIWSKPASDGKYVYLASMDHFIYTVDLSDGSLVRKTDVKGAVVSDVILSPDGVIYAGTLNKEVVAIQASEGNILWKIPVDNTVWAAPLLHDGVLYFGDTGGELYALDAKNGSQKWKIQIEGSVTGNAAIYDKGLVFVTDKGNASAVGFDGTRSWTHPVNNGKLYGNPVLAGDHFVVAINGAERLLVTLDMNGNEGWSFIPPK